MVAYIYHCHVINYPYFKDFGNEKLCFPMKHKLLTITGNSKFGFYWKQMNFGYPDSKQFCTDKEQGEKYAPALLFTVKLLILPRDLY